MANIGVWRELVDQVLLRWIVVALVGALVALRVVSALRRRTGLPEGARVLQEDAEDRAHAQNLFAPALGLYGKPDVSAEEFVQGRRVVVATELKPMQRRTRLLPSDEAQAVVYGLLHQATYGERAAPFARVRYAEATFDVTLTPARVDRVLAAAAAIRAIRRGEVAGSRNHQQAAKCVGCAVRHECPERLDGEREHGRAG